MQIDLLNAGDWKDAHWVSRKLNIKYDTLKKQRQRNIGLPYHTFGRLVRYNTLEIKQYLQGEKLNGKQN